MLESVDRLTAPGAEPPCCALFVMSNEHHHPTRCTRYVAPSVDPGVFKAPAPATPEPQRAPRGVGDGKGVDVLFTPPQPIEVTAPDGTRIVLIDPIQGEYQADVAVSRARNNADPAWMIAALSTGFHIARTRSLFTSADIDIEMSKRHPSVVTHDKRAMGAVVRQLIHQGAIVPTNTITKDPRPNCHRQNKRVLRSLLFN